jgi:hypothetical protein
MNDLSKTILAKSDQMNADDLAVPITIKVTGVRVTDGDQPTSISFEGDNGKPYKPCKSMRRVLVRAWGADSKEYVGRSMALYNEPTVKWGGQQVGGIRISAVSHIERDFAMPLTITRGQKKPFPVKKLQVQETNQDDQTGPTEDEIEEAKDAARTAAKSGKEAFGVWWNSDEGKTMRGMVRGIMPELQKTAAEVDAMADE